jgi:hypothetical protein
MAMLNPFSPQRVQDFVDHIHAINHRELIRITEERTATNQAAILRVFGREAATDLFVDGQSHKPLSQAQEFTLTRFHLQTGVVDAAIRMLMERSPVGPGRNGHYRDNHWLFVNDVRRDATAEGAVVQIKPGDNVVIINMKPYARKIEGGTASRSNRRLADRRPGLSAQAPNGVYEITARDLQRLFGTTTIIRFTYRALIGGALISTEPRPHRPRVRSSRGRFVYTGGPRSGNASKDRFPALEIEARPFA